MGLGSLDPPYDLRANLQRDRPPQPAGLIVRHSDPKRQLYDQLVVQREMRRDFKFRRLDVYVDATESLPIEVHPSRSAHALEHDPDMLVKFEIRRLIELPAKLRAATTAPLEDRLPTRRQRDAERRLITIQRPHFPRAFQEHAMNWHSGSSNSLSLWERVAEGRVRDERRVDFNLRNQRHQKAGLVR